MKKYLFAVITLCLLCLCVSAFAVNAEPGQTVSVTISVTTSGAYCSVGISYDSSVLTFVSASGGNVAPQSGSGRFIFGSGTAAIGSASGTVTFQVSSSAAPGTYNVSAYKVECYDTSENDCGASVSGGSIVVKSPATAAPTAVPVPGSPTNTPVPGGPTNTPKPTSQKTKNPYATPTPAGDLGTYAYTYETEDGPAVSNVKMITLGLARCIVKMNDQKIEVPTLALELSNEVNEDKQLAVIYAPNSGKVSLRKTEKSGSDVIMKCDAGVIVTVERISGEYTQINYLGRKGWVKNTSLKYYSACEELGRGKVSNTSGADTKLYLNRDNDSWKITKLQNGTELILLKEYKEWYEVDVNGYHGFVYKKQVKVTELNESNN